MTVPKLPLQTLPAGRHLLEAAPAEQSCVRNPKWQQRLDVFSPYKFDNSFFLALAYGDGVLTSDMALVRDNRTLPIVREYVRRQPDRFSSGRIARSMIKLSYAP
uniref:Plant heme peroxidase family profile domain-containing protein n=1 Tax=Oryza brachyantha TaxID=4533 RepID=J3LRR4_ORYBR